ncbi:hypothetical protein AVEN_189210-1 [Araneus ventricosus]|uniref:Uncharacterized protein n=1 Tax=Araneus ventricosus TaxID=182803 RepID=A0A4Y2TF57_ARAVE|nr:hypothetical protein AVEN_189210-1 [Araneus ventricosus]
MLHLAGTLGELLRPATRESASDHLQSRGTCVGPVCIQRRPSNAGNLFGPICSPAAETASSRPYPSGSLDIIPAWHPLRIRNRKLKLKQVNQQSSETGGSGGQLPNRTNPVLYNEVNTIPNELINFKVTLMLDCL